jgi:hypothetical protein
MRRKAKGAREFGGRMKEGGAVNGVRESGFI